LEGGKKNIPYVSALGLDKLNFAGDSQPDGNFDFVEDVTIDAKIGVFSPSYPRNPFKKAAAVF
jgi:hypothetical protein